MTRGNWTYTAAMTAFAIGLSACGARTTTTTTTTAFPDLTAQVLKIVPKLSTVSFTQLALSPIETFAYSDATALNTDKANFDEIFGEDDGGVNTKIRIQLNQAKSALEHINANFVDADGNPANCTQTLTASTAGFKVPFFGDSSETIFWAGDLADTGKYSCFATWTTSSNNNAMAFGKEAITAPAAGCTDAYRYYVAYGYDNGSATAPGHQIQKFVYDGCTGDIGMAMAIASDRDESVTNGSSQGFHARFELWGNTTAQTFESRTYKVDMYAASTDVSGARIEAKGSAAASGYIRANFATCTENAAGTTLSCSPASPREYCLQNGATAGAYSIAADTTTCDTYTADLPTAYTAGDLGKTGMVMNAAAFGL